jgi:hypothetical protein
MQMLRIFRLFVAFSVILIIPGQIFALEIPEAHYQALVRQGVSVEDFIPDGWQLKIRETADFNRDGIPDAVLLLQDNNPENVVTEGIVQINTNPRRLVVLFGTPSKNYNLVLDNHKLIPRLDNSAYDDYIDGAGGGGVFAKRGILQVSLSLFATFGAWEASHKFYTFRWQDNRFVLIGYDYNSTHRASGRTKEVSINFLTGKLKLTCGNIETDDQKSVWEKLPPRKTITLDAIGSGVDFDPQVDAVCENT